jgi:calcineurin-like phosphoesterase family protein
MADIWVISDTHFNHNNIIKYCNRPFDNPDLMNEFMVDKWNSVVKPQDKVYHLGDVYMGGGYSKEDTTRLLSSLNGKKRLILGNHDNGKDQILQRCFEKISIWRMFPEFGLLLTHVPVHESALVKGSRTGQDRTLANVHGHIHNNPSPEGPYRCACVEHIDYTPINIEELRIV